MSEPPPFPLSLFSFVDCQLCPSLRPCLRCSPFPTVLSLVFCLAVTFSSSLVHARVLLDGRRSGSFLSSISSFAVTNDRPTQSFHASSPSSTSSRSLVSFCIGLSFVTMDAWIVESSSWCVSPCVCSYVHVDDDVAAQALDAWSRRLGTFYSSIFSPSWSR